MCVIAWSLLLVLSVAVKEEEKVKRESKFSDRLLKLMREMFGANGARWSRDQEGMIEIHIDTNTALLDPNTLVSVT